MSAVTVTLGAAALVIGLTGAWSPCGFSMVETIGPRGHSGGRASTLAACGTFTVGAVAGGALTFGALAVLGGVIVGVGGRAAYLFAAGIALAAAVGEARGVPIVPQIRRQLPEPWRWRMPMPVVAALYGVLLGLGFTTFVLTLGVWALAGISFALGRPELGLVAGIGFGIGRALPVVGLAPLIERPIGVRVVATMAERPGILRGFRAGDAIALVAAAVVMTASGSARAAPDTVAANASDPTFSNGELVWHRGDGTGILRRSNGHRVELPGRQAAIGGPYVAVRIGARVRILDRTDLSFVKSVPGSRSIDSLAVSGGWLVYRVRTSNADDRLRALPLAHPAQLKTVASAAAPAELGRPYLDHAVLVYAANGARSNKVVQRSLTTGRSRALLRATRLLFTSPSIAGRWLAYVRTSRSSQQLRLRKRAGGGAGRILSSRKRTGAVLWSTALSSQAAFVTRLSFDGRQGRGTLLRVSR
jgi:MFS family permease